MYNKDISIEEVPDVAGVGFKAQMKLSFKKKREKRIHPYKISTRGFCVYIFPIHILI